MDKPITDKSQLRKFGFILSFGMIGIFGVLIPFLKDHLTPSWPYAIGIVILIPTLIQPLWLKAIYTPWMKLGAMLGWFNTRVLLGILFFFLITPMGILMRLGKKDPMQRSFDKNKQSYRILPHPERNSQHMEKPY
ncbi:MAG: hypothetical protein BGO43_15640 [Gammaproteobacteria bacterium 39-13]|nr:sxtJ [Gammaproteobacteria bacterium]OJV87840.1 MAG: hypothetical protein BGO43_15640 [Gammaproteobacteria bacterium 39-13]